jgi:septal ring factor EnvC (AmiA/AmiB activator)
MALGETALGALTRLALAAAAVAAVTIGCGAALAQASRGAPKSPPALETLKQRDQELDAVRTEQRKAAESEQKLAIESDSIAEDRRKLNQSLIETAARIRVSEERIASTEMHLHQLDLSETDIRKSLDGRRALITEVLAALQRIGHRPPPAVFSGADDAIESLRTAMSLGAVLPQMRGETDRLLGELSELARVKKEMAEERRELTGRLAELAEAQKGMAALIEERQKRQAEIEQAIGTERQRVLTLSRQADNLKELIGKLEQGLDVAGRLARAAAARSGDDSKAPADARPGLAASKDPGRLGPAIAFVSAKGRLSLPVIGAKIREFGAPDGMGGTEKGISIATRSGAQVTAPCDGWVVYAAPYRSYGQLLILNVGGGYHVLLAGMERITVDLGQFVLTGEPVAVMGSGTQVASNPAVGSTSIGSSQPVLYVEFRRDGTPVDPSPWWAATENEKGRG